AERVGDVGFGVSINAPAPLAPATRVSRTGPAVAARARRTTGNCANEIEYAGRNLDIDVLRRCKWPSAIGLRITFRLSVDFFPIFSAPGKRDRAREMKINGIGEVRVEVPLLLAKRPELEARLRIRPVARIQRLAHRECQGVLGQSAGNIPG